MSVFTIPVSIQRFGRLCGMLVVLVAVFSILRPALAQNNSLQLFSPVTGTLERGTEEAWTFTALNGAVLSFSVEAASGDLDPAFKISGSSGNVIIRVDDYDYPKGKNALAEAITIPRTDTYTVTVSANSGTSGDYQLTMTSGFSQVASAENFNGNLTWKAETPALGIGQDNGQLGLVLSGPDLSGVASNPNAKKLSDYYVQTTVKVSGQDGWIVGMTARQQDTDHYYALYLNDAGQWRFVLHQPDGDQVLRDWVPHPAIVAGNTNFTLGMMVNGAGFDFFYNGQFFGSASNAALSQSGEIGLLAGTHSTLTSQTSAHFDDLYVTTPLEIDGRRIVPSELVGGKPGDTAQELQRRGLIPAGGDMALTVTDSFVESRRPGVAPFLLGRGVTFQNMVFGATFTWQAASLAMTGCGLIFQSVDSTHYLLAYLDQTGGYGLSQRDGDSFKPGIFGQNLTLKTGEHRLLIVARDNQVIYYVDEQYAGTLESPTVEGAVGNAVVNFEPINTSCRFGNSWVWAWN